MHHVSGQVLGIVEHVGGRIYPPGRHARAAQRVQQGVRLQGDGPMGDQRIQFGGVGAPCSVGGEALVGCQLGLAHEVGQPGKDTVGIPRQQHVGPISRRVGVGRSHTGQRTARPGALHSPDLVVGQRGFHQRCDGLVDGDVHLLAAPAGAPLAERRQCTDHGEESGQRVPQADPTTCGRPVGVAGGVADTPHRLAHRPEPRLRRPGAGLAEAGHVHHHQARVLHRQRGVVETPLAQAPRAEVLDDHVGVPGQSLNQVQPIGRRQVGGNRTLVAADRRPPQAVAPRRGHAPVAHRIASIGALHLDDVGAVIAQQLPGEGPRDETSQLQHPDSRQRTLSLSHRWVS